MLRPSTALLSVFLIAPVVHAQNAPGRQPDAPIRIDVDFAGGTVAEYVDLIRVQVKGNANIVLSPEAGARRLPALRLTRVAPETALAAITYLDDEPDVHWFISPITIEGMLQQGPANDFAVRLLGPRTQPNRALEERTVQVFSIGSLFAKGPPGQPALEQDHVLSAVETALEMQGGPEADLRLHSDSGLLILSGTKRQIGAIDEVLAHLRSDLGERRKEIDESRRRAEDALLRARLSEINVNRAEILLRTFESELARAQQLVAEGAASQTEIARLEAEHERARLDVVRAGLEAEHARSNADRLVSAMDVSALIADATRAIEARMKAPESPRDRLAEVLRHLRAAATALESTPTSPAPTGTTPR